MTKFTNFARCSANSRKDKNGRVAEWLGKALQKLLHRFESGRNLLIIIPLPMEGEFFYYDIKILTLVRHNRLR